MDRGIRPGEGGKPDALVVPDLIFMVKFIRLCPLLTPETSRGKREHYGTRYGLTPRAIYSAAGLAHEEHRHQVCTEQ